MNSIQKRSFRGINYVRLSELSEDMKEQIGSWLNADTLIKIKTENGIERDCVQLKDFLFWFENHYTGQIHPSSQEVEAVSESFSFSFKS